MTLLVETTVKVSLILLLALAVLPLLRRRSAALRHWVLSASLLCAAVTPLAQLAVPSWHVPVPVVPALLTEPAQSGAPVQRTLLPDRNARHIPCSP